MTDTPPTNHGSGAEPRAVILLDVDGVLNACRVPDDMPGEYKSQVCNGWNIQWRQAIVDRLRKLHDEQHAEIRWLTTWAEDANEHISPALGLPVDLTVVASPYGQHKCPRGEWWKLEYAQAAYDRGDKVVWLDDDLAFDARTRAWLTTVHDRRMLALAPDTEVGLTPEHLDAIEAFLKVGA